MASNVFKDYDTAKTSYHIFVKAGIGKLNITNAAVQYIPFHFKLTDIPSNPAGSARASMLTHSLTVEAALLAVNQLFSSMSNDSDINTIGGDILKAFGTNGLYMMEDIESRPTIVPVHDENILMQINNMTYPPFMVELINSMILGTEYTN